MSHPAARAALASGWGVRSASLRCLRDHWNTVYRVDAAGARYVLRVHSTAYHDVDGIESELRWLRALCDDGVTVPEPVGTRDGRWVHPLETGTDGARPCTLLRWVDGRRPGPLGPRSLAELGGLVARLHDHADAWRPPHGFQRPVIDVPSLGRWWFRPHDDRGWHGLSPAAARAFRRSLEHATGVERELRSRRPDLFGLVHADLHRGNLLRTPGGLVPIDFDDCGIACRLYDLAIPLAAEHRTPGSTHGRALLRGYRARRSLDGGLLPDGELLPALEALVAARAAAVSLFVNGWAQDHPALRPRVAPTVRASLDLLAEVRVPPPS